MAGTPPGSPGHPPAPPDLPPASATITAEQLQQILQASAAMTADQLKAQNEQSRELLQKLKDAEQERKDAVLAHEAAEKARAVLAHEAAQKRHEERLEAEKKREEEKKRKTRIPLILPCFQKRGCGRL